MSQWELTTELLMFETTKEYQEDPTVIVPAFDLVLSADGTHQPGYYGKQIENAATGYIFCNWDSYEAHERVLDSDLFPKVKEALLETSFVSWDTAKMYHTIFSDTPIALEQPVTEVTILTLKSPDYRDAVVDILTQISKRSRKMFVFGVTHEDENKYLAVCGWESVQAHRRAASNPEVIATLKKLYSLAEKNHSYHTHLLQVYS